MLVVLYLALIIFGFGSVLTGSMLIEGILILKKSFSECLQVTLFAMIFIIPGILLLVAGVKAIINTIKGKDFFVMMALRMKEKKLSQNPFRVFLMNFREHYSEFFKSGRHKENEAIQWDATQIYRNILEFRKKRLKKLGITCEMRVRNMKYFRPDGISSRVFSDGKYDITEAEEEVASETIYKKEGNEIYSQMDKDLACYTIVHTKQAGENTIVCPNCGMEATKEELMDGCDYCGTKFLIEDLGNRVSEFSFRPDYNAAMAKYKKQKNMIIARMSLYLLLGTTLLFTIVSILSIGGLGDFFEPGDGVLMGLWAAYLFFVVAFIILLVVVFLLLGWLFVPLAMKIFHSAPFIEKPVLDKLSAAPKNDRGFTEMIRQYDPYFSISNFYSGLQNKISAMIYADNKAQLQAFSQKDLSNLLGHYKKVINIETEYMGVLGYSVDEASQYMQVEVCMDLLEYAEEKCSHRKVKWIMNLVKSAACKTQVLCAPAMMKCQSCGAPFDLLTGKECSYCGNTLELENYDWVIQDIQIK